MVSPLHRFSGGVYRVPTPSVRWSARPPGTAIGEMNPVQGMSWRPNPVSTRCMVRKARSPKRFEPLPGRPHGDGGPVVVRGWESRPHGEAGQVGGWSAREVRDMRDAETTLAIVQDRGRNGLHLEDVYRRLFNPDLYLRAYGRISRNAGALTGGATEETVDGMSLERIRGIIDDVRHERYRWTPVRRILIPKANGKMRPLGIPTWSDKL